MSAPDDIDEQIAALGRDLARAVSSDDFEEAARLRDEIDRLAGVAPGAGARLGRGRPGAMGLGTDQPSVRRPPGWRPPPKPDPMTRSSKGRREPGKDG